MNLESANTVAEPGPVFDDFGEDDLSIEFKLLKARQFGDQSLSYSAAAQRKLRHFANEDGFLAYQCKLGHTFVLGDPVIAADKMTTIIDQFLERFPRATFCQVSESTAKILNERRYWVNQFGIDTRIDLACYSFSGKEKERFRYAANWLKRRDFRIVELDLDESMIEKVKRLCESWRQSRILKKETSFLNRPFVYENEIDVRRFFLLDSNDELQAFVFFDPLYQQGKIAGYVTTFKRRQPTAPSLAEHGICKTAIEKFKSEGHRWIRLGLSPFADISNEQYHYNWILQKIFRYYYHARWANRFLFNLQGHAAFKNRFRGTREKMYFASPTWYNDVRLFALMRLSKFI